MYIVKLKVDGSNKEKYGYYEFNIRDIQNQPRWQKIEEPKISYFEVKFLNMSSVFD